MVVEPAEALAEGPIERYLEHTRARLVARHDPESVEDVLAEFHAHLVESAAELLRLGLDPEEAENRAIELFGASDLQPIAEGLAARTSLGDRAWGRIALVWSLLCVSGFSLMTLWVESLSALPAETLRAIFLGTLLIYGFACVKARAYAMFRITAACSLCVLMVFCLFGRREDSGTSSDTKPKFKSLLASNTVLVPDPNAGVLVASDLGTPKALIDAIRRSALEEEREAAARRQLLEGATSNGTEGAAEGAESRRIMLGLFADRPMDSFSLVQDAIPAPARLGGLWLLFAFLIRGTALWITKLAGIASAHSSVWLS